MFENQWKKCVRYKYHSVSIRGYVYPCPLTARSLSWLRAVFVRSTATVVAMARTRHGKSVIVIGFVCIFANDRSNKTIKNASANTKAEYTRFGGSHW